MKEECQKYGSVVSVLIPKENPGKGQVTSIFQTHHTLATSVTTATTSCHHCSCCGVNLLSQVFVEYTNSNESKEAQKMLTGRTFDGKFVVATFYPRSSYKRGYLYQCSH